MKLLRLQGRKTSGNVLRKGKVWKGKTMVVNWLPGPPRHPSARPGVQGLYVGTFASARLHKSAVVRNRMRRRVREAFRIAVKDMREIPSAQLLLSPRSASLRSPHEDILQDVRTFLSQLSWPNQNASRNSGISSSSSPSSTSARS